MASATKRWTSLPHGNRDNTRKYKVPEGHYFMMGDNRDNSVDSRYPQVGFVPFENFMGRAEILFFSIKDKRLPGRSGHGRGACAGTGSAGRCNRAVFSGLRQPLQSNCMSKQPQRSPVSALKDALATRLSRTWSCCRVALTHASALAPSETVTGSYQRLEFLGDRVLGLVIASMLHKHFPKADEGELARRFNHMVKRETCAEIAQELGVGDAMRIGLAEAQTGGRKKTALLADICESIIAAIYLDGGFEAAEPLSGACGSRVCYPGRVRCGTPRPRCRNGPNPKACRRRAMTSPAAKVPITPRVSPCRVTCRACPPAKARVARNGLRNKARRKPSCAGKASGRNRRLH